MNGVDGGHDGMTKGNAPLQNPAASGVKRPKLTADDYVQGVLAGDRMLLSRAITLVESNAPKHMELAQEVLQKLLPYTGNSIRVGITWAFPVQGKAH